MSVNNQLAKRDQGEQRLGIATYLKRDAVRNRINSILGSSKGTSFITSIVSAVQATPALKECTNQSILSAALIGESLNLSNSPSLGQFWMIPYKNKKKGILEASFQLGANGFKQLAMRTGQYLDIDFIVIYEGEYKGRDSKTGKQVFEYISDDDVRESLPVIGYKASFTLLNGFEKSIYWTRKKMEDHADKYSQAFSIEAYRKLQNGQIPQSELWKYSSYWYSNFDGMAEKTLIKHLLSKWGILSTELRTALESDMTIEHEDGTKEYVDTEPDMIDMPADEVSEQPQETPQAEASQEQATEPADVQAALFGN